MTDLTLDEVNVHVVGVVPEKAPKLDPDNLFADDADDDNPEEDK